MRKTLPVVLHNPRILLIGAGNVAAQKADVMARNGIDFDVVALECSKTFASAGHLFSARSASPEVIADYRIVIDATGNEAVTAMLTGEQKRRDFMLNVVDRPELCDFFFAALIEEGPLKIAVSSSGASPAMAQSIRDKIRRFLPRGLKEAAEEAMRERFNGVIRSDEVRSSVTKKLGHIYLIGCGTGDAELLTLKAYRLIRSADVALIDHLISEEIVALIPEEVEKIYVGKCKGRPSVTQEAINALLIEKAKEGLEVARLKSGDPYIFGRGSEEAEAAAREGVAVEVIPGISSAIAGPASAGIAPTARGYATNMSIVSAHLAGNRVNLEWIDLLKMPNHTTIVLMGLSRAAEISEAALRSGASPTLKTAIISDASRLTQKTVVTTLEALPEAAKTAHQPAIIVFGEVVALHGLLPHY